MTRLLDAFDKWPWWSDVVILTVVTLVAYVLLDRAVLWWERRQ